MSHQNSVLCGQQLAYGWVSTIRRYYQIFEFVIFQLCLEGGRDAFGAAH